MLNIKKLQYATLFIILLFTAGGSLFAADQEPSAVRAMQLFDAGKYEAAEIAFSQLLEEEPENTMLNYYYGASRTENGHFSEDDLNHLLKAGREVTPRRINYYLGMQYQARENWDKALKNYNQYRANISEEEQQELDLPQKIQQCFDKINPYEKSPENGEPVIKVAESKTEPGDEITEQEAAETTPAGSAGITEERVKTDGDAEKDVLEAPAIKEENLIQPSSAPGNLEAAMISATRKKLPDLPGVELTYSPPPGDPVNFQVNSNITYLNTAHFKTEKGKELFSKASALEEELQENVKKADKLRKKYRNTRDAEEKAAIGDEILKIENESYRLQDEISQLYSESRRHENSWWQRAGETVVNNFLVEFDKLKRYRQQQNQEKSALNKDTDSTLVMPASTLFNLPDAQTNQYREPEKSPLVYKIQIGAYSRKLPSYVKRLYDKLSLIRKIENYTDENGVVVYTTGNLTTLDDAIKMRNQVRQEGVEDAFVVPYFNGKRITLEQAKKIEARNDIERN